MAGATVGERASEGQPPSNERRAVSPSELAAAGLELSIGWYAWARGHTVAARRGRDLTAAIIWLDAARAGTGWNDVAFQTWITAEDS
jgi:hypothetical protein